MKIQILIAISLFFFDRLVKYYVYHNSFYVLNKGIIFGINMDNVIILILIPSILVWLLYLWKKRKQLFLLIIFIGGLSNLLDRFIYSGVIDYINILWIPTFNTSDIFINLGIMGVLVSALNLEKFGIRKKN